MNEKQNKETRQKIMADMRAALDELDKAHDAALIEFRKQCRRAPIDSNEIVACLLEVDKQVVLKVIDLIAHATVRNKPEVCFHLDSLQVFMTIRRAYYKLLQSNPAWGNEQALALQWENATSTLLRDTTHPSDWAETINELMDKCAEMKDEDSGKDS